MVNFVSELPSGWSAFLITLGEQREFRRVPFQLFTEVLTRQQCEQIRPSHFGNPLTERALNELVVFHNPHLMRGFHFFSRPRTLDLITHFRAFAGRDDGLCGL